MTKFLKIALTVTLAAVLVLGVALPVLADSDEVSPEGTGQRPRLLRGTVVGVDGDQEPPTFTIEVGERDVEIEVNEGTKYFTLILPQKLTDLRPNRLPDEDQDELESAILPSASVRLQNLGRATLSARVTLERPRLALTPNRELAPEPTASASSWGIAGYWQQLLRRLRQFAEEATFDDIAEGDRVVVWGVPANDGFLAKLVFIIKPAAFHRVAGTVLEVEEIDDTSGTITIEPKSGTENTEMTFDYDEQTTFTLRGTPSLKEGMQALIVYVEENGDGLLAKKVVAGWRSLEVTE